MPSSEQVEAARRSSYSQGDVAHAGPRTGRAPRVLPRLSSSGPGDVAAPAGGHRRGRAQDVTAAAASAAAAELQHMSRSSDRRRGGGGGEEEEQHRSTRKSRGGGVTSHAPDSAVVPAAEGSTRPMRCSRGRPRSSVRRRPTTRNGPPGAAAQLLSSISSRGSRVPSHGWRRSRSGGARLASRGAPVSGGGRVDEERRRAQWVPPPRSHSPAAMRTCGCRACSRRGRTSKLARATVATRRPSCWQRRRGRRRAPAHSSRRVRASTRATRRPGILTLCAAWQPDARARRVRECPRPRRRPEAARGARLGRAHRRTSAALAAGNSSRRPCSSSAHASSKRRRRTPPGR